MSDAVGAPPAPAPPEPAGWAPQPDGDTTIERAVVRGYLPPPAPAPRPAVDPDAQPRRRRVGPVLAVVALVAAVAAGAFVLIPRDDDDPGPDGPSSEPGAPPTSLPVPAGLTAVESAAGVQLDWDGDDTDVYAVLMMSELAEPRVLPAETGTSLLVPVTSLVPDDAYCFAVAYLAGLEAAPRTEDAFGPPVCIRGASEDTIRPR